MKINDAQARAYIAGESPFDPVKYELMHVERLAKVIQRELPKCVNNDVFRANLRHTASHWIELHREAANIQTLVDAYKKLGA